MCQVNICLQFPEYMRGLYVVCARAIDFQFFLITLFLLSRDAHSHQLYLVYAMNLDELKELKNVLKKLSLGMLSLCLTYMWMMQCFLQIL